MPTATPQDRRSADRNTTQLTRWNEKGPENLLNSGFPAFFGLLWNSIWWGGDYKTNL